MTSPKPSVHINEEYEKLYGFHVPERSVFKAAPGLDEAKVRQISAMKQEPAWMLETRLRGYRNFLNKPMPQWANMELLNRIRFGDIYYYLKPTEKKGETWEDVPPEIKETFDRLGIPEAERKFLAGVSAQYESESVYHSMRDDLQKQGVIFLDMDSGLKEQPDLVRRFFGTIIPPADNKFAALNTAVWSGGSFIYVPKGVRVAMPLQAYFRINAKNMGQFERTLIIADEGAEVTYIEGCTAPVYSSDSLHSAVVELLALPHAKIRYVTIQNWSKNVYNLVTKRAVAQEDATVQWLDGNLGCLTADSMIFLNPRGPVAIKDVRSNDHVYAVDLDTLEPKKYRVVAAQCTGVRPTYRVVTANYREVKATDNHPFLVLTRDPFSNLTRMEWRPLATLRPGEPIAIARGVPDEGQPKRLAYVYPALRRRGSLKHRPALPPYTTDELMWLLGLYVGDGYIEREPSTQRPRRVFFAVPERDRARARLERAIHDLFGIAWKPKGLCVTINSMVLADFILSLGLVGRAKEKRIPSWIFGLPQSQKLAFVEGYLDADGFVRKQKENAGRMYGQLVFASCHRALLEDFKLLLINCGLNPLKISEYVKERRLFRGRLKEYRCYDLSMNIRDSLTAIRSKVMARAGLDFIPVKSIEPLGEEAVYDIEVEGAHNFIANGIVVHNSRLTMKYPGVYLMGRGAHGEVLSVAFASDGQHQDAGAKMIHAASETSSVITSKSISKGTGRTSYRGLVKVYPGATNAKSTVRCDALLLNPESRSDTYPTMEIDEKQVQIGHEATVSKIGDEQLFYAMSRGLTEQEAMNMIVNGFIEPFVKELPLEYAVELNRLVQLEMAGAVG